MLLLLIIIIGLCIVSGAVFFWFELSITIDRLRWFEERLVKLEKDAVKVIFAPPFTNGDDKVIFHPDVKVTPPPKKRKPKTIKDWEDEFDIGGNQ